MTAEHQRARVGVAITACVVAWLLVQQLNVIAAIGNGLSPTADPYSESNAIRAAQHYTEFGFFVDAGLPHITYGPRFPATGWVVERDQPLAQGVYTRYPPLPDLLAGLFERLFGFDHLWAWRLIPLALGLAAIIFSFVALRAVLGGLGAGVMTFLLSATPVTTTHMHGLHYEGYAHALLLVQLALLTRILWSDQAPSKRQLIGLGVIGFVQGWLSYDYAFVVMLAAAPLAVLARASGREIGYRRIALLVTLCAGPFVFAAALHVAQVAWFYHSLSQAFADLAGRAAYRAVGAASYGAQLLLTTRTYVQLLWLASPVEAPLRAPFGALLPMLSLLVLAPGAGKSWRGPVLAMLAAYAVSWMWLVAMPSHAWIHTHFVPRSFFLAYFVVVLAVTLRFVDYAPADQTA